MTSNSKIKLNLDSLKSRKEWKRHKVKDGHNIYRVLPPFGEASNGYPYRKWQIIWGLTDPESGRARPFASSMVAEKRCPITEYVNQLKTRAESMTSKLKADGVSEEDIRGRLKDLQDLIGNLIPKTVYVYNAADKGGEVGLLELKSTAHKDMKEKMNKYIQDYNQDPTSLNSADDDAGVWFDIIRSNATGKFRDTKYEVEKVQTKVKGPNGVIQFVDDRSPLPESIVENYDNLAYDLSSIYQAKTYDELQEVLDANMPGIVELVPDANLSIEPPLVLAKTATPAARPAFAAAKAAPAPSKITTRLYDEDDDAPAAPASNTLASRVSTPVEDDDFMTQADKILNG